MSARYMPGHGGAPSSARHAPGPAGFRNGRREGMKEETTLMEKPKKLWNSALKMVKGEDSAQLMESFTAEMTLVAEGLCEDQNRLRGEVNQMMNEEDRRLQRQESRTQELETMLEEREREQDRVVTELRNRLAALEKQAKAAAADREREEKKKEKKSRNWMRDLTILIVVAGVVAIAVILVNRLV